jgi:hypothetical protein
MTFYGIVHWICGDAAYGSRGNRVFVSADGGRSWAHLFDIPLSFKQRGRSLNRLAQRLFRAGVHHITYVPDNTLVLLAYGAIYVYDLAANALLADRTKIEGSRPLALCNAGDRRLYYGEYRRNPDRTPVRIIASDDGGHMWQTAYEFTDVRHVHGVFHDPYEGGLWVTTGDKDNESAIWVTHDDFRTVDRVLGGRQQTRAIQLLFTKDHVYFGSDTPLELNHVYRLSRRDGELVKLHSVEGSVFHGCRTGAGLFFSTACEPSQVNSSRTATVWGSTTGDVWRPVARFEKDAWPARLFQYGQIMFAGGQETSQHLWLTPFAVKPDQLSLRIDSPGLEA